MSTSSIPSRVSFYIGIEKDRNGNQIEAQARSNALTKLRHLAASTFGGYTMFHGAGGWINPAGELIEEGSIRLDTFSSASYAKVWGFAQESGKLLDQATILAEFNGNASFIDVEPSDHYGEIRTVTTPESQSA